MVYRGESRGESGVRELFSLKTIADGGQSDVCTSCAGDRRASERGRTRRVAEHTHPATRLLPRHELLGAELVGRVLPSLGSLPEVTEDRGQARRKSSGSVELGERWFGRGR